MHKDLSFPHLLDQVRDTVLAQKDILLAVAGVYADAFEAGGLVHVYANGHSRIAVEEMCVRMGALTGFHPLLSAGLTTFTDVVGVNGIRVNQAIEFHEGLGDKILDEFTIGEKDCLLVVTATGTTPAAIDMAQAWSRRRPDNPLIGLCCKQQSETAPPKHSSGQTLSTVIASANRAWLIDNGMPAGDLSLRIEGGTGTFEVCPLSSIGVLAVVQSLNELTLKELDRRGIKHMVLQNMHLGGYGPNYDEWLSDQRTRYARTLRPAGS